MIECTKLRLKMSDLENSRIIRFYLQYIKSFLTVEKSIMAKYFRKNGLTEIASALDSLGKPGKLHDSILTQIYTGLFDQTKAPIIKRYYREVLLDIPNYGEFIYVTEGTDQEVKVD